MVTRGCGRLVVVGVVSGDIFLRYRLASHRQVKSWRPNAQSSDYSQQDCIINFKVFKKNKIK